MDLIDVHSHILHNIDDGAKDLDISIELLKSAYEQGVRKLILTPHYDNHLKYTVDAFLKKRAERFSELEEEIKKRKIKVPEFYLGAEVSVMTDLSKINGIEKLAIGNTRYILLEMPYTLWYDWMFDFIFKLITQKNLIPVIAHIERYFGLINPKQIQDLSKMELYFQINAASVVDKMQFKNIKRLINNDLVYFMGSDAHDLKKRPVLMKQAADILEKKVSKEFVHFLTMNSGLMLDNNLIDRADDLYIPKKKMSFLDKLLYSKF